MIKRWCVEIAEGTGLLRELASIVSEYAQKWLFVIGNNTMVDRWDGDRWQVMAPLPAVLTPRDSQPIALLDARTRRNQLIVFSQRPFEDDESLADWRLQTHIYDCSTNVWETIGENDNRISKAFRQFATQNGRVVATSDCGDIYRLDFHWRRPFPVFRRYCFKTDRIESLPVMLENRRTKGSSGMPWYYRVGMDWDPYRLRLWNIVINNLVYFDTVTCQWFDGPDRPCTFQGLVTEKEYKAHQGKLDSLHGSPFFGQDIRDLKDRENVNRFQIPSRIVDSITVFETFLAVRFRSSEFDMHIFDLRSYVWSAMRNAIPPNPNSALIEHVRWDQDQLIAISMNEASARGPLSWPAVSMVNTWDRHKSSELAIPNLAIDRARMYFSVVTF